MEDKKFSYCPNCISAQYFTKINNVYVCEECGKPLQPAKVYGTNVTSTKVEPAWTTTKSPF